MESGGEGRRRMRGMRKEIGGKRAGRSGSRREEKAERGGREGRLKVKVETEGRERKKDINRKGSCVEVGIC